jgi:hypothetical protein
MVSGEKIVLNFITDSTGRIERFDTTSAHEFKDFKYNLKEDTIFEQSPPHLYEPRKWIIIKLDRDSLIMYYEGIIARYHRIE